MEIAPGEDPGNPPRSPVPAGFGDLAGNYASLVRVFFSRRCPCREDAEDLAQEAFCAIIKGASRFRGDAAASTWIFAICRNVWSSWLAEKAREARLVRAATLEAAACNAAPNGDCSGIEDSLPGMFSSLDLAKALTGLSHAERRLYGLYYLEGRRVREIAAIFGKPEGTVKYLLSILRSRIKALLS